MQQKLEETKQRGQLKNKQKTHKTSARGHKSTARVRSKVSIKVKVKSYVSLAAYSKKLNNK